jgi:hypothetical protein
MTMTVAPKRIEKLPRELVPEEGIEPTLTVK